MAVAWIAIVSMIIHSISIEFNDEVLFATQAAYNHYNDNQ